MKNVLFSALLLSSPLISACSTAPSAAETVAANTEAELSIEGMTCASCSLTIKTAVRSLDGLSDIKINVDEAKATVRYDKQTLTAKQIEAAITRSGYAATVLSSRALATPQ